MLKALELVGFKSFADKTRLEFPPGITVVVGPNGSGKSNIVDAIKWVLGEQSAKTLRGKEMADVIFNGSSSRRPLNSAETTLTFDNSRGLLAVDSPEVHVTRRVYRSGEGEYLINRQPCRLRDIRDLLAGTGAATEAYSVIEQGKVDILLQASPKDRRFIFEEAAGISRFKSKKLEAQRRLERVDQNLLRLSDIVEEVDSRLRTVRLQAAKARRYKEHADRLQELRTQVGLADWRKLSDNLEELEREVQATSDEAAQGSAQAEASEARSLALELSIAEADQSIRGSEERLAQNRERIAGHEATLEQERRRHHELEEEVARYRRQLVSMRVRAGDLQQQWTETCTALDTAEALGLEITRRVAEEERNLTRLTTQFDEIRAENEQRRTAHLEQMRAAAALGNQISALESQVATTGASQQRGSARLAELAADCSALEAELAELRPQLAEADAEVQRRQAQLRTLQDALAQRRRHHARSLEELAELRQKHSGMSERASLLEDLERRQEGLTAGVREVLKRARESAEGPFREMRGLVADLLHVNVEAAPLVELALGDAAQYVVIDSGSSLIEYLQKDGNRFAGRVGFIRLDTLQPSTATDHVDLKGQSGVIGRADQFVESASQFAVLARRLLGKTWFVDKLSHALALSESNGRGLNFVTRAGEWLGADGTILTGARHNSTGLISRRSELRALKQQIADLTARVEQAQTQCRELETQIESEDGQARELASQTEQAVATLSELKQLAAAEEERRTQLDKQRTVLDTELAAAAVQHQTALNSLADAQAALAKTESTVAEMEDQLSEIAARTMQIDQARQRIARETNGAKIELAKSEQQLDSLRSKKMQLERDQHERSRALADSQAQLASCADRAQAAERAMLRATSETADLYLRKEKLAADAVRHLMEREAFREQKNQLNEECQKIRAKVRKLETKLHAKELAAGELRHERTALADRMREDYGIELDKLDPPATDAELVERDAIEKEIAELRSKIQNIGSVNLDALAELEELEARFALLSSQHQDLSSAKNSLEQIIAKINADSRRLFGETLEVVRGHFQNLFRKLFGGGQADIVLDKDADILESGIEIVARPPGKEPRSISLLSGGEKTLTCVALLLAIFRSRPSPFCVLDEVDAALDEANIERFISVLTEFLAWTQFIVVTHSKKTMTCANTIYGVTMQESGISKRVSVRFEDVRENGEITAFTEPADEQPQQPATSGDEETQAA